MIIKGDIQKVRKTRHCIVCRWQSRSNLPENMFFVRILLRQRSHFIYPVFLQWRIESDFLDIPIFQTT